MAATVTAKGQVTIPKPVRDLLGIKPGSMVDFQRAPELGLHGIVDAEVLRLCAEQNRLLVTHDRHTMPKHFIQFIQHQDSPGVFIVSRRLSIGNVAEWLLLYWAASEAEEYQNQIIDIP